MGIRTIIPFGPQHPVLPEPIHLDLVIEDEKVVEAIPSVGFVHRGLEKLVEKKNFQEYVFVAERICGICSFIHGMTYCLAVEELLKLEVPQRAQYLRVFWSELSRIHSHLLWLGLTADSFGFESLFMQSWKIRERILDIIEETTGGRVIFGTSKVGGVRRDIARDKLVDVIGRLKVCESEIKELSDVFLADKSVHHRLAGLGMLSQRDAYKLGAVGPTSRASGNGQDMRCLGYAAYKHLRFEPVVETAGDSLARCKVRIREIFQSLELIRQVFNDIPQGEIETKVVGMPAGETFVRSEQPRGEAVYYIKADGTQFLKRLRVRTPTFANLPALLHMLKGCELADVPVLVLTIDPCISCTER